jgi:hypothetical protein
MSVMTDTPKKPRERRTPITEAYSSLMIAMDFWCWLLAEIETDSKLTSNDDEYAEAEADHGQTINDDEHSSDAESYFIDHIFGDAWNDPNTNGDELEEQIGLSLDGARDPKTAPLALIQIMFTVVAYTVQAWKSEKSGKHDEAWTYAADAQYWAGILNALHSEKIYRENPAVSMANRRHEETRALKKEVIKYWKENIDPHLTAQKAANKLLDVFSLSHKTLAEYISEGKKTEEHVSEAKNKSKKKKNIP